MVSENEYIAVITLRMQMKRSHTSSTSKNNSINRGNLNRAQQLKKGTNSDTFF